MFLAGLIYQPWLDKKFVSSWFILLPEAILLNFAYEETIQGATCGKNITDIGSIEITFTKKLLHELYSCNGRLCSNTHYSTASSGDIGRFTERPGVEDPQRLGGSLYDLSAHTASHLITYVLQIRVGWLRAWSNMVEGAVSITVLVPLKPGQWSY